ncbi:unnamed protein product, partial [Effrenium voratum]
ATGIGAQEAGSFARGADCMKMWPWMRDLPSHIWAGRGWAYDESGPHRLPSAGGAGAMQGVQVLESIGKGGQPAAPDQLGQATSLLPAGSSQGVKPARMLSKQQAKQSG